VPAREGAVDPADPDVVPTGLYGISVGAASCNVNDAFQRQDDTFLIRSGTGMNIPLPSRVSGPNVVSSAAAPRQDFDLETTSMTWERKDDVACPNGSIRVTLTRTELMRSRVAFAYREEPSGCTQAACEVDFGFELTERACPPASGPSCVPQKKTVSLGSGDMQSASQEVSCVCASR
jgi:hypothetical protein